MQTTTSKLGMNRTGLKASPVDARKLLAATADTAPTSAGDESALAEMRLAYIAMADALGSVPPPPTMRGMAASAVKMMTGKRPQALIDKLADRLAFERSGTRLYEALLIKRQAYANELSVVPYEQLQQFHDEEARHFKMLHDSIEEFGADPTAMTPCADVTAVEGIGLMQVVTDPRTTFLQSLHAILIAELTDVDAWETLIALAQQEGQDKMAQHFTQAHAEEEKHLKHVRRWYAALSLAEGTMSKTVS